MPGIIKAGIIPHLIVGGRCFTDLKNLLFLGTSAASSGGANKHGTFRLANGTAGYQVPASTQLRICAMKCGSLATAAAATSLFYLGYADNDAGTQSSITDAPTNPIFMNNTGIAASGQISASQILDTHEFNCNFVVPAAKYPLIQNAATTVSLVQAYGYLEAV